MLLLLQLQRLLVGSSRSNRGHRWLSKRCRHLAKDAAAQMAAKD
jgi:hypothetical protein